jgi:phosphoadenosine phosphosulfate reductase
MLMDIQHLTERYARLSHRERLEAIFEDFERVLVTSSFGTTSAILLHHLARVRPGHPVYFIDTQYHFKETYAYAEELSRRWGLNVVPVQPKFNEHAYTRLDYTWAHDPDLCCSLNKIMPLEPLKEQHQVWVSGMLGDGNELRRSQKLFKQEGALLRFYPFFDMNEQEGYWYRVANELPDHPLEARGYGSIGCTHCTRRGTGRSGRWAGFSKTECGLHTLQS